MIGNRTPWGAHPDIVDHWLHQVAAIHQDGDGLTAVITPEMLVDFAEWVAAAQRETIAQILECMPETTQARHCAAAVRNMRAQH